jgi:hypothetical protein
MTADGAGFSSARYRRYVNEYTDALADVGDYGVPETATLYARIEPIIDRLYADWVAAGRPGPEPREPSTLEAEFAAMFESADIPWEQLARGAAGPIEIQLRADGSFEVHSRAEDPKG